ncbi:hypothetical protein GQ54DRAFT_336451, partial [Martensiomyces pterosporus]
MHVRSMLQQRTAPAANWTARLTFSTPGPCAKSIIPLPLRKYSSASSSGKTLASDESLRFQAGDMVIVRECSRGGKHALIGPLADGRQYGSRKGNLGHSDIIGRLPRDRVGAVTKSGSAGKFMVHHPTLEEYVLLCNRRCTPIYPKDASAIIAMLDVSPGDRILEAGTGNA